MNDNLRLYRRVKSRPASDLRRKVLLKNFLREQMSTVPSLSASLASNENLQPVAATKPMETENVKAENNETNEREGNSSGSQESVSQSSSTLVFDFSKITELKLSQLAHVRKKSTPLSAEDVKRISKAYSSDVEKKEDVKSSTQEKVPTVSLTIELGEVPMDKFNQLAKLLKDARTNKEKSKKGVSKAKYVLRSISNPLKKIQHSGRSLRDKIALKMKKFDESFKQSTSQNQDKVMNSSEKKDLKEVIFESGGVKFSIQHGEGSGTQNETKNNTQGNDSKVKDQIREKTNTDKPNTSSSGSMVHPPLYAPNTTKNTSPINGEKKLRLYYKKGKLINIQGEASVSGDKRKSFESPQSQSSQTDITWSLNEIKKLERANKRLREENRLLSESLSSIMADVDIAFSPYQKKVTPTSHDDSLHHLRNISNHSRASANVTPINSEQARARVSRSRSVQDRAERRREVKLRLSSRSMCHRPYSRISPKSTYRAKPCIITSYPAPRELPEYQPNTRVLRCLPEHNYSTTLSRKSSMPERVPPRPILRRRSSCVSDIEVPSIRRSLLSLPDDAFY